MRNGYVAETLIGNHSCILFIHITAAPRVYSQIPKGLWCHNKVSPLAGWIHKNLNSRHTGLGMKCDPSSNTF